ncbi:MAG: PD40 domain-containing protein [Deltaproteobacteria bacterium]|jgi:TolB protein|nr:MAG: PD40 domain-containing protein [Deltaproteobacteria bacterium]
MNLRKLIYINGMLVVIALLFTSMAQAKVYLDITSPEFRKVPFAVPYFTNKNKPGRINKTDLNMTALLTKALEFHGFISVVPVQRYDGSKNTDWVNLGVDYAIITDYESTGETISFEFRLIDITEGRMLVGKRYKGSPEIREKMILRFCDEVIYQLTGERGISLSNIAFSSEVEGGFKEIFVADVLGRNIKQITRHKSIAVSPKFSQDGTLLAYSSYHPGNPNLYVTDWREAKTTRAISRRPGLNLAPAWSPDGKTMVITLSKDGNPDLYLISKEGVILNRLTKNTGINVSPAWSPDGKHITFVSDRSGSPQIYIMNVKTKSVRRITFQGNDNTEPSWSPNGDWIAYSGLYEGRYQIFIIKPEGGQPLQLTWYRDDHESPSWSPDSRQVVFTRRHKNDRNICRVFRNGTGFRTLFHLEGHQSSPEWSVRME